MSFGKTATPIREELGDRGGEAVEPDNGPKLDSVTEQPRQAGEVHISALTHFDITIDGNLESVMAMADSGSQIPVIGRETIAQLNVPTLGQIKSRVFLAISDCRLSDFARKKKL